MSRVYSPMEVREIIGLVLMAERSALPDVEKMTTIGARQVIGSANLGDLRHWVSFVEVFAFSYNPDTLEVHAVTRSEDFLKDPVPDLLRGIEAMDNGGSIEVWGIRHDWAVKGHVEPECIQSKGRRPSVADDLRRVMEAARGMSAAGPKV